MDIIWHGHSCFELVSGGYSAVIDPFQDTSVGTAYPHVRLTADAVYISHEDRDHNFREGVTLRSNGKTNPFAVTELETYHDIMRGRLRGMNTVRIFAAEGMRVAHLGDLGCIPDHNVLGALQNVDVMLLPVGGHYTIDGETAAEIVRLTRPRTVIPMHYKVPGLTVDVAGAEDFLKRMEGAEMIDGYELEINPMTPKVACFAKCMSSAN
mgnify:CR=1 FL=1